MAEVYKHIYTHPASHPSLTREGLNKPGIIKIQGGVSKKRGIISIPCLYLCNYPGMRVSKVNYYLTTMSQWFTQ